MNISFTNINNDLSEYLNNISNDNKNDFINEILHLGFQEFKKKSSNLINTNVNTNLINILDNQLNNKFDNLKLLINEIRLEQQNTQLQLNTNNNKGCIGEQLIYNFFHNQNYHIEDTSGIAHSGDLCLYLEEINQNVLIEIKNYKNTVDQKQIDKFYYDLNYTGIKLGIFISLQSKIVNTKFPIEWKINEANEILVFISECKTEYLYLAVYSLILLFKNNNYKSNLQLIEHTELYNDIKYLSTQKESINKIKNEILTIHESCTKTILTLYNNLCIFDNNFNYIINKIYNKLDNQLQSINKLYLEKSNLNKYNFPQNIQDTLDVIISDLSNTYKLEFIENKKIKIIDSNELTKGEIKILKTTINIILNSGLELKNITIQNWIQIKSLI